MMSRKGVLPEADFYFVIPPAPLNICTKEAIASLIAAPDHNHMLDNVFALFKAELLQADPDYARQTNLEHLTLEEFAKAYFRPREEEGAFAWAERNLDEAKRNQENRYTVPWRNAILQMHEVVATAVPHFLAEDYARFQNHFKYIFVDDYATVPARID